MKANELMIGDLVNLSPGKANIPNYVMIHAIKYDNNVSKDYVFDIVFLSTALVQYNYSIRSLKPIPLTPEILEKNGFIYKKLKGVGGNEIWRIEDDYYDIDIYEWSDSIWIFRYDCNEMSLPHTQVTMSYVHELRHALRLCVIEKEIKL